MTALDPGRQDLVGQEQEKARRRPSRVAFWVAFGAFALVMGIIIAAFTPSLTELSRAALAPDHPGPDGAGAVTEVLRDHDIEVIQTSSRADAQQSAGGATLVVGNTRMLSDKAFEQLISTADIVVLIDPSATQLDTAMGAERAGFAGSAVASACSDPRFSDIKTAAIGSLYSGERGCFPSGDGYGLLISELDGRTMFAVDGTHVLANSEISQQGNAALSLRLLSQRDRVIWYVPSAENSDLAGNDAPTLGSLTPRWVTPVIVLLFATALAAIWWRGRRIGPLVLERLPVTVKLTETLEGRAKLYAKGRDHAHAASILRRNTIRVIARAVGLGASAPVQAVSDAASALLGLNPSETLATLGGSAPHTDAELMQLSDRLIQLESAIGAAFRVERNSP